MTFRLPRQADLSRRVLQHLAGLVLASIAAVLFLSWAGFPAALLLGPVIVSTTLGLRGTSLRVPRVPYELAQGVAGCMIAHYLTPEIVDRVLTLWPLVLLFAAMTVLLACFVGFLLGLLTSVESEEAIWGFLPGMAGAVIAMSDERGLDSRIVAFIQIIRLMAVILVMSIVSRVMIEGSPLPHSTASGMFHPGVLITLLIAALAVPATRYLPIPAGATMVPLVVAAALQGSGTASLALPGWLLALAYFVLGTQVGLRFTPQIIRSTLRIFWPVVLFSLGLMMLCAISGLFLSHLAGVDLLTAMLATVPGSIETIAIIAVNSNANLSFIMTMQVIRLFAVVLAGPIIARSLSRMILATQQSRTTTEPGE